MLCGGDESEKEPQMRHTNTQFDVSGTEDMMSSLNKRDLRT